MNKDKNTPDEACWVCTRLKRTARKDDEIPSLGEPESRQDAPTALPAPQPLNPSPTEPSVQPSVVATGLQIFGGLFLLAGMILAASYLQSATAEGSGLSKGEREWSRIIAFVVFGQGLLVSLLLFAVAEIINTLRAILAKLPGK